MERHNNFDNVKLGDLVKYNTGGWYNRIAIGKVTNVTPTQFCVGTDRFRKSDGKKIGEYFCYCQPATAEELEQQRAAVRKMQLANSIANWFNNSNNVGSLTSSQLEAIKAIITPQNKEK